MDTWLTHFNNLLIWLLADPSTPVELVALSIAGALAFVLVLTKVGDLLGVGISSAGRSLAILIVTLATWFFVAGAASIYLGPEVSPSIAAWLSPVAAALVLLVISAPLMMFLQKSKYLKGLVLMVLSIAAAVGVILLASAAFGAAREGGKEGDRIKGRTSEVNDFLSH